ncbi:MULTISPECIES: ABC transporter permease subunit [unclassified Cryobacterium]|uniref:ABC transporter permease subunit n=1 Tax=unclassified Cryobacterium TaxID=2649013 RepID=UPI00106A5289|nr:MULTISPECIES: ABC transporter permease subunit [unclassified Cryobacterium]TFD06028.1 ABC transporter permease [Cryobacterium sp. TMT1-66-1]TFD12055.1 ABC transporter permease [Cryobacterium sp. TMT1-2-2]
MSTVTPTQPSTSRASFVPTGSGLSFTGLLRSETIKLWSLRSTYWTYSLVIVAALGFGVLMSFALSATAGLDPATGAPMPMESAQIFVIASTSGLALGQLIVAVLGVLSISGEYSSGMIKSTLTAVPNRLPALWAKVIVLFVFTFLIGLVSVVGAFLAAVPRLSVENITASLFDVDVLLPLLGNVLFLALIAVFAVGIGTIVRSSAGGIATVLGILLLLPTVVALFSMLVEWVNDIVPFLFTVAGSEMVYPNTMESWQAFLVVIAWVAVSLGTAALLLKRRDA